MLDCTLFLTSLYSGVERGLNLRILTTRVEVDASDVVVAWPEEGVASTGVGGSDCSLDVKSSKAGNEVLEPFIDSDLILANINAA